MEKLKEDITEIENNIRLFNVIKKTNEIVQYLNDCENEMLCLGCNTLPEENEFHDTGCGINADPRDGFGECTCKQKDTLPEENTFHCEHNKKIQGNQTIITEWECVDCGYIGTKTTLEEKMQTLMDGAVTANIMIKNAIESLKAELIDAVGKDRELNVYQALNIDNVIKIIKNK